MSTLDDWLHEAAAALDLPADSIDTELRNGLLDVTRDVAHGITRVAGPLTTYLAGMAVGSGMTPAHAIGILTAAAAEHTSDAEDGTAEGSATETSGG